MIYFLGPKVYKFLRKTLQLPSKSTLLRITRKWEINPGFNDFIFSAIQIRVNTLGTLARDCVLCLDEMPLKTFLFYNISQDSTIGYHHSISGKSYDVANNVLVVMARGINSNWKQPIAYFFLNSICSVDDLIKIIFSATTKLQNIGLNVLSVAEGSNCIDELDSVLVTINDEYMKQLDLMVTSPSSPPPAVHIDVVDYRHWDNVTEQNGFEYVTGYLARKCCERHSCDLCIGYIFGSGVEIINNTNIYTHFGAYKNAKNSPFGIYVYQLFCLIDTYLIWKTFFQNYFQFFQYNQMLVHHSNKNY
ncbi:hypothetical protein ILUMI_04095 [Ignelater luminosus]|uniref:Transposable element P transposase-like RNase H domain-containing protein n=1 Tax=Ignelater luminosus TaxID=2038154 RepID=A0A8K0DFE7_IGNLU|nr:hypothetical protein ILUMI_04095 [Ignelater luminosus]